MSGSLRIGTRGSKLALWQANEVARRLRDAGATTEIVPIRTSGDKRPQASLASIGGKGVFIKELEEALAAGTIDLAVHSLKDVPSIMPDEFVLSAFLERGDPRDAWVQRDRIPLRELPAGLTIGTSAPRRRAQLRLLRPDIRVEEIRGNVDTRMAKVRSGIYAGAVLAAAGLQRLDLDSEITSYFSVDEMIPAAGQGIIVVETLRGQSLPRTINDADAEVAARCERGVLQKFDTLLDCYSAVAVHATIDRTITLRAFFGDGETCVRVIRTGRQAAALIDSTYDELVAKGARELLER
jgi:hydroxymethylbilane synthase